MGLVDVIEKTRVCEDCCYQQTDRTLLKYLKRRIEFANIFGNVLKYAMLVKERKLEELCAVLCLRMSVVSSMVY